MKEEQPRRQEVCNTHTDDNNVTWEIMAYERLTPEEMNLRISSYLQETKNQTRPKPFSVVRIPNKTPEHWAGTLPEKAIARLPHAGFLAERCHFFQAATKAEWKAF